MNLRQFIKGHWSALIGGCLVLLLEVIQETGYVMNNDEKHFEHNDADCFNVRVPLPGAPGRIFHVGLVLNQVEEWAKQHPQEKVIVCILECRIGPLLIPHAKKLHKLGAKVYCNPDGLEWKRSKWSAPAKAFLRYCEKCLVENSDLAICDSVNIEKYIKDTYGSRVKDMKVTYRWCKDAKL